MKSERTGDANPLSSLNTPMPTHHNVVVPDGEITARISSYWSLPATCQRKHFRSKRRCESTKCSRECRDWWAMKWSNILRRSFKELPPTQHLRLTLTSGHYHPHVTCREQSKIVSELCKAIVRRKTEYFRANEWSPTTAQRHQHFLLRSNHVWDRDDAWEVVSGVLTRHRRKNPEAEWHVDLRLEPVHDPDAIAKYVVKDVIDPAKKSHPPHWYRGQIAKPSGSFLSKSKDELWLECRRDWHGQR